MYVTRDSAFGKGDLPRQLIDREEVIDALYRFGLGQDLRDRELFTSAFAADAVLDFRPAAIKCGLDIPLMEGRDTIVDLILNPEIRIDTTHVVTNARVTLDGDTARLTAIVEAQHLPKDDHTRHALLKNLYSVDAVRDGSRWVMRRVHIDNVWYTGDPWVITGK
ncbi:nuclear transport factor 2 family protein [Kribbella sancticallisti]|uniref:Nuclear transport factor 2 family protein n=1 Tax=Kribbella sancticallisti TaxID=460087 RepID=A0ABP4PTC3_9ACTN